MKNKTVVLIIIGSLLAFFAAYFFMFMETRKKEQAEKEVQVAVRLEQLKTNAREGQLIVLEPYGLSSGATYEIKEVDLKNEKLILLGDRNYPIDVPMDELAEREFRLVPLISTFAEKSAEQE